QRSAGPSDDAIRALGPRQKRTDPSSIPARPAPARPGSPAQFATALSTSTSPNPHPGATTQSPSATLPYRSFLRLKAPPHIWEPETTDESHAYDNFHGIDRLVQPSGIEGLIVSQPARGFASMVQRKGLAMVR